MINVILADDHVLFREGIKKILSDTDDIVVTDEVGNGQTLIDRVKKNAYDVILLDISMPGRSGLDVLKQLMCEKRDYNVLALSMHSEEEYAERMLQAGASGYLVKQCIPKELITAIRKVSSGRKYVSSSLAERLASRLGKKSDKVLHERLSDREFEIMCLIASGKPIKEIAEELSLSSKTVSTHRAHILEKMGMKHNSELMHYALQNHFVD
jgi:DNA-binding NarL/FixJ family response regulator